MCSGIGTMQLVAWTLNIFCVCNINLLPLPPCWERERVREEKREREKHKHDSMRHHKDLTFWHGVLQHKSSDQHKFYQSLFSYQSLSDLYIYMLTWLIYIQEQMSNLVTFVTNHCPNTLATAFPITYTKHYMHWYQTSDISWQPNKHSIKKIPIFTIYILGKIFFIS